MFENLCNWCGKGSIVIDNKFCSEECKKQNNTRCLRCKYYNIDDKDGSFSTGYPYCELDMKTPHQMAGDFSDSGSDLSGCNKWRSRIKCECPFNLEARKEFYDKYQGFSGIEEHYKARKEEEKK